MITRQLESAQTRIEGFHFDSRKQVLAYDDILNKQRQVIYARRRKLLTGVEGEVSTVLAEVQNEFPESEASIAKKRTEFTDVEWSELMRRLILQVTDIIWVEHLEVMNYTRSSVNLRAYGQRDPLIEYRKEGSRLFKEMQIDTLHRISEIIPNVKPEAVAREEEELRKQQARAQEVGGDSNAKSSPPAQRVNDKTYGRNDIVTVSDGKETKEMKYKKAEVLIAEGKWKIIT